VTLTPLVGVSVAICRARALVEQFAASRLPVLLVGETGTGKELLAEHLHARSERPGRLVAVNCAVLPQGMADSLLFGHRRGAFSGAVERRRGHFRCAERGTLFLDELLSLPPDIQPKLLRAVETGEVQALGDDEAARIDVRLVAAVQVSPGGANPRKALRDDLYRRLAGVAIHLPPLRARPEDIPALAEHFAAAEGRVVTPEGQAVLANYRWPGNVRELRNAIARAGHLVSNGTLPAAALAEALAMAEEGAALDPKAAHRLTRLAAERERILGACREAGGHAARAAQALKIGRTTLFRRLKQYGLTLHGDEVE
jgi:DNA-binding NtrC family response regulator